ncbi:MAG: tripartite tricarboxylate transporter substrate-binding protein [Burkholderiaceae bacterium]|nr:tripartite tricarboxylate transporter substrate-binding protein [Burkholderiaceae bacterium]
MKAILTLIAMISCVCGACAQTAGASFHPTRPVTLIVPYAAGGGTDSVGRMFAKALGELWGQAVVVDNRVGASGIIGANVVAKAAPDGHTLLLAFASLAINPYLFARMPYDTRADFRPITTLGDQVIVMAASPRLPANDVNAFVDMARKAPGVHTFASSEAMTRMYGERLAESASVKLVHVPYKGGQWLPDLVSGTVDSGFSSLVSALPMALDGRIKILGVSGNRRSERLPQVKTFQEQGLPSVDAGGWIGLFAPARMAPGVAESIHADVIRVLALPEVKTRLAGYGIEPGGEPPAAFAARFLRDIANYGEMARKLNLQPE